MKLSSLPRLMRIENCAMALIAVAIGFIVAGGLFYGDASNWSFCLRCPALGIIFAAFAVFLITGAGNAINDYYDRDTDAKNSPHRPIPQGDISARAAFYFAMSLFIIGIVASAFASFPCLCLASFNSFVLFFYARNLKSTVFWGNLSVSYLTASTFVYGALVLGSPIATFYMASLAFFANMGREVIGDIEDIVGDKKSGITTFATKFGDAKSWALGRVFIILAVLLSPLPYLSGIFGLNYLIVVCVADALFIASVITKSARLNQKLTKIGIFAGLIAFLVGALL